MAEKMMALKSQNAANQNQWSGGEAVPGNPWQHRVTKTVSAETTVTATLGSTNKSVNVWIIWATVTIQASESNPSPLSFLIWGFPDNSLGLITYDHSYSGIYAGSSLNNLVAGKICAVATVTPPGIHSIISLGWDYFQKKTSSTFSNGALLSYNPPWTADGPDHAGENKTVALDNNDKLYTIDAPTLDLFEQNLESAETYKNFYNYITWNEQVCSDTNNFWHFQARWQNGQFTMKDLEGGTINVRTNAYYSSP